MKLFVISILALGLAVCPIIFCRAAQYTGSSKVCVDGVQYIQFTTGASVQYDKDGKVVTC